MKIGSLFAGIGGIELGFQQNGFEIKWANEIDEKASITYKTNFKHTLYIQDLRTFHAPSKIDILTAGFPCQAFSIAGLQKGFNDDRGNIFFEILRIIDEANPSILFLENVKNLTSHDRGRTFSIIKKSLEGKGFNLYAKVLNTKDFGIPQNRERIYIVGFKQNITKEFKFPKPLSLEKNNSRYVRKKYT